MMRIAVLATIALTLVAGVSLAAPQPETTPDTRATESDLPEPAPSFDRPEVQVLLSSIDMTVSLIDAYGRCREEAKGHEECMAIIRSTLDHARSMIGQ
jgi:hypothetical protein